jgi:hypothetical protein
MRRLVLLAMALVTVVGAVAHAWRWLAGPEAATTGLPLSDMIEGVLSEVGSVDDDVPRANTTA